jgi:hypothetical protein
VEGDGSRNRLVLASLEKLLARGEGAVPDVCDVVVAGTTRWIYATSGKFGYPAIPDSEGMWYIALHSRNGAE